MTLAADEFIRRFLLHSLPPGMPRIRHYGLFAGRTKTRNLARCRELLGFPSQVSSPHLRRFRPRSYPFPDTFRRCPSCLLGIMIRIGRIAPLQQNSS
jgi:Putative transposase